MALALLVWMVGLFLLGLILDHSERRYGRPPRIFLRYEFLAVLIGLLTAIIAGSLGLLDRRRKPGAKPGR